MRLEITFDDRSNIDGFSAEPPSWPAATYEVPDDTASRWLEAQKAWKAVVEEAERFTRDNKSERQLENERRDDELIRKYYL